MATTLTVCKGCLHLAEDQGNGILLQERICALQERIEKQLGPVELQLEECLHHCMSHEVCVRLDRSGTKRSRWTHLKPEPSFADPAAVLLKRG